MVQTDPKMQKIDGTEYPVNSVTRVEPNPSYSNTAILIVEDCVLCGDEHTHGIPDATDAEVGYTGQRGAHCDDDGDYVVKITEETSIDV